LLNRLSLYAREFVTLVAAGATALVAAPVAAQSYPSKPIRIVVPFAAGSTSDNLARTFADELRSGLGATVLVENKPGASGVIGMETVARAAPDGYTLMISSAATHSAGPWLLKQVPYDAVKDFAPVARLVTVPFILAIHPSRPEKTVKQFVEYAKANESKLNYSHGTSSVQVAAATFGTIAGFKATGVPYKGQSLAVFDLMSGQVQYMFGDNAVVMPHVKAGKLRAIAITSPERSPQAPDVPTLAESGYPGFDIVAWVGLSAPAGTPRDIVQRINGVIEKSLAKPELQKKLLEQGLEPAPARLADFEQFVAAQYTSWGKRVRDAGIKPE
jgi:tripartite-type tricarboxylate transporter receptor subunit TctC